MMLIIWNPPYIKATATTIIVIEAGENFPDIILIPSITTANNIKYLLIESLRSLFILHNPDSIAFISQKPVFGLADTVVDFKHSISYNFPSISYLPYAESMHFVHRLFVGLSRQVVFTAVAPMHGAAPGQSRFDEHFGLLWLVNLKITILALL